MLKLGSKGNEVKKLQNELNKRKYVCGRADGIFGHKTLSAVRKFQHDNGLRVDGIVGQATKKALYQNTNNVRELQTIISQLGISVGKVDGISGAKTVKGIKEFQKIFGLHVDGIAGKNTWSVLNKLKNVKNFSVYEFACKHCKRVRLKPDLLVKLEELRKAIGNRAIIVNSGYRCATHNRNVGGAKNSQHLYGSAADIVARGISVNTLYNHANKVFSNGGVGRYKTFVHVDVRGHRARW